MPTNLLFKDGEATYHEALLDARLASHYYQTLWEDISWRHDELKLFGKRIITKRMVAWYGNKAFDYRYSGSSHIALPWTKDLLALKSAVETATDVSFNCCLLNRYHNGNEGMGWHSDDESTLDKKGPIASLSLGASRRFSMKHKESKTRIDVQLNPGSLFIMDAESQQYWQHALPVAKRIAEGRINLTFRVWANH